MLWSSQGAFLRPLQNTQIDTRMSSDTTSLHYITSGLRVNGNPVQITSTKLTAWLSRRQEQLSWVTQSPPSNAKQPGAGWVMCSSECLQKLRGPELAGAFWMGAFLRHLGALLRGAQWKACLEVNSRSRRLKTNGIYTHTTLHQHISVCRYNVKPVLDTEFRGQEGISTLTLQKEMELPCNGVRTKQMQSNSDTNWPYTNIVTQMIITPAIPLCQTLQISTT